MAKQTIDVSKIKGFDEMSYEDKVKALMGYEFEDKSEELNSTKDMLEKQKKATDKASSEAADFKRQLRDKMSADEKAEADRKAELETLRAKVAEQEKLNKLTEYKANAISMGYSDELATKRAEAIINGDFVEMTRLDKEFLVLHDKETQAKAIENTSQPPASGKTGSESSQITAEQFKNMSYREMVELKEKSPELYAELSKSN